MSEYEFIFPTIQEVIEIQAEMIDEFGGSQGLRDAGALESALRAAENRRYYEEADLAICAATYAYHLTQAHAFIDGNKRIGDVAAMLFLKLNGAELQATQAQIIELFLKIAAGETTREEVETFFASHIKLKS